MSRSRSPSVPPSGFGARLAAVREAAGMTQQALSDATGIPTMTLSKYERGLHEPNWAVVIVLADALGVDVGEFREEKKRK